MGRQCPAGMPIYLFDSRGSLEQQLNKVKIVCLLLDFDGTLTPFASRPSLASLPEEMRRVLEGFTKCPKARVCIISGRSLADIKQMVGIDGICYAGNHGLEIQGLGLHFTHPGARAMARDIADVYKALATSLDGIDGVIVEDKGLTASVHYRLSVAGSEPTILEKVEEVLKGKERLMIRRGKKVLEVRPNVGWGKGEASLMIIDYMGKGCLPIYIGDDQTDEEAFKVLKNSWSVLVSKGGGQTEAKYYLNDPREVQVFLMMLYDAICGS
jgi:trehalose 6-phosphate phosphatase